MSAVTNNNLTDAQALEAAIQASLKDVKKDEKPKAKTDDKVKETAKTKVPESGKNEKSEAHASTPLPAKKVEKLLTPTTGAEWTKAKFGFGAKLALKATKATVLKSVVESAMKKNGNELTPELWAKIDGIKIDSVNTCGDAEKHAVDIINWFEKKEDAREYTHDILKEVLQSYAKKGIGVITDIKKITEEAQAKAAERSKAKEAITKEANAKAQKA